MSTTEGQTGAIALATALMLLVMLTLIALSAAQIGIGDLRSVAAEVHTQQVQAAAEAALARGLAYARRNVTTLISADDIGWQRCDAGEIPAPCGDGVVNRYGARWTALRDLASARVQADGIEARVHYLALATDDFNDAPQRGLLQIVGDGRGGDTGAAALIRQDVRVIPLLYRAPEALLTAPSVRLGGQGQLRLASSQSISVWSSGDAQLADATHSCIMQAGVCGAPLSTAGIDAVDIVDVDGGLGAPDGAVAPGDVVERLFGVGAAHRASLRDAMQRLDSCLQLDSLSHSAYWIDGDCELPAGAVLGPLLLVVADGRLISHVATLRGIVLMLSPPSEAPGALRLDGRLRLEGALLSDAPLVVVAGEYQLQADAAAIDALTTGATASYWVLPIPGSWRDY